MVEEHEMFEVDKINEAISKAIEGLPTDARATMDQGISHVRDVAKHICTDIEYGDKEWREVWTTATLTLYSLLVSLSTLIPSFTREIADSFAIEFMLIGSGDKEVDLEGVELDSPE